MKRLLPALLLITGSLLASAAYSQVYVDAHLRLPVPPIPRMHVQAAPVVVETPYQQEYAPAQPYYDGYDGGQVVVTQPEVIYSSGRYDHRYYDRYHGRGYYDYYHHNHGYYRGYDRGYGHDRGHWGHERRHW